ncbi:hypothetical protein NITHO_1160016 [Nitrolancea hollandica Lb]|uniref:Uncharacterized protein n=1 Tax=Nitrolancea hollandica Lb TaxID=1129897 RepID=I4ECQ7_9BACT|nr:hypothetical protein NITHO_1160016 [Nitrolancea hollandica Lb]
MRAPTLSTCLPSKRLHTFLATSERNHDDAGRVPASLEVQGTTTGGTGHLTSESLMPGEREWADDGGKAERGSSLAGSGWTGTGVDRCDDVIRPGVGEAGIDLCGAADDRDHQSRTGSTNERQVIGAGQTV